MTKLDAGRRRAAVARRRADPRRQGRSGRRERVCQAGLRLHARLHGRPEGVPGRLHQPDPDQDVRRRPGGRRRPRPRSTPLSQASRPHVSTGTVERDQPYLAGIGQRRSRRARSRGQGGRVMAVAQPASTKPGRLGAVGRHARRRSRATCSSPSRWCCSWCSTSARSCTRCTSACGSGTSARDRSASIGLRQLHQGAQRPDLPDVDQERHLLRGHLGAADHGGRPVPGRRREPEDPRPDVLPRGVLLPGHRQLGRDHDPLDLPRGTRWLLQRGAGRPGPEPDLPVLRLSAPTRTGSATSAPRCNR